jgi:hypothetical protein
LNGEPRQTNPSSPCGVFMDEVEGIDGTGMVIAALL